MYLFLVLTCVFQARNLLNPFTHKGFTLYLMGVIEHEWTNNKPSIDSGGRNTTSPSATTCQTNGKGCYKSKIENSTEITRGLSPH